MAVIVDVRQKVADTMWCTVEYAWALFMFALSLPQRAVVFVFNLWYIFCQAILISIFKPRPPRTAEQPTRPKGRIAVIGAGLTGISTAAHAIAHGFDVVIFEKSDKIGGIWANVNKTSGLQLNSLLYRFFPSVRWSRAFPHRDEIVGEITKVWRVYKLEPRTRFKTKVTSVRRAKGDEVQGLPDEDDLAPEKMGHSRWIINDGKEGVFDAVVVTVGTCGEPNMITLPGMPGYKEKEKEKSQQMEKEGIEKKEKEKEEKPQKQGSKKKPRKGSQGQNKADTAWTHPPSEDKDEQAVAQNQEEKKAQQFFTPGEAFHGEGGVKLEDAATPANDAPTQDDGAWAQTKPQENAWDVNRNQVEKKEQGFPTPGEAFEAGADLQEGSQEKSLAHQGHGHARKASGSSKEKENGTADNKDAEKATSKAEDNDEVFKGPIIHSSQLDAEGAPPFKGKTVAVIGGGASAVEAVEAALTQGAAKCYMFVRDDKWIIPRNIFIDTLIALQPFGREMPLSFLWEKFITYFNYYFVTDLTPARLGLFDATPVVNDEFLGHVRKGRCKYIRADTKRLTPRGVLVNVRGRDSKPGDDGFEKEFDADIVVLATGFKKPDVGFLEQDLFPEGYDRPNLYLQTFATEDWSILMTNSAYMNAIGTVGHFHIGIYARILMTFLMDKNARPTPKDMKLWVDCVRFIKRGAEGGALGFFTYMELMIWLALFHIFRMDRLKWLFFILQGWGVTPREYYGFSLLSSRKK